MPTYNAEETIRQSLASLRKQDYNRLEILISDNASTDRTGEICLDVATKDERIRYHRNDRNVGSLRNFWSLQERAKGEYFMWAADHDLWAPSYIRRCVDELEDDPSIAICYARTMLIDRKDEPIQMMADRIDTRGMPPPDRFRHVLWTLSNGNMIYGVIRRRYLASLARPPSVISPDYVTIMDLTLKGTFAQIPEPLFLRRARPGEDSRSRIERALKDLDPHMAPRKSNWSSRRLQRELQEAYLDILRNSGLSYVTKLRLGLATIIRFSAMWPGFLPISGPLYRMPADLRESVLGILEKV